MGAVHCLVAAMLCLSGAEAFASNPGIQLRLGPNRALRTAGLSQLQCATSSEKSVQQVGRKNALQGALALLVVTAFGSEASAKKSKENPCQPGLCVKATSPGIALDMIILMKSAQAMREAGEKLESGDFKTIETWLTNGFSSTSFAFVKKTKVLESLSTSLMGVSVSDDFDADPSFNSEESVDSKKAAAMAQLFYAKCASVLEATKAKDQEEAMSAFEEAVESLDALLKAFKMPTVENASPEAVRTPK